MGKERNRTPGPTAVPWGSPVQGPRRTGRTTTSPKQLSSREWQAHKMGMYSDRPTSVCRHFALSILLEISYRVCQPIVQLASYLMHYPAVRMLPSREPIEISRNDKPSGSSSKQIFYTPIPPLSPNQESLQFAETLNAPTLYAQGLSRSGSGYLPVGRTDLTFISLSHCHRGV